MAEDGGIGTAGLLQGIGKDRQTDRVKHAFRQLAFLIGGLGQGDDVRGQPGGVDGDGAERVADDVSRDGPQCPSSSGFCCPAASAKADAALAKA